MLKIAYSGRSWMLKSRAQRFGILDKLMEALFFICSSGRRPCLKAAGFKHCLPPASGRQGLNPGWVVDHITDLELQVRLILISSWQWLQLELIITVTGNTARTKEGSWFAESSFYPFAPVVSFLVANFSGLFSLWKHRCCGDMQVGRALSL